MASWDSRNPEMQMRELWSISVNPKTGLAVAYDKMDGKLIGIDENGKVSVLPNSFDFDTWVVLLDHAADGTLYAIEVNKKGVNVGPLIERNIIRFDEKGSGSGRKRPIGTLSGGWLGARPSTKSAQSRP